VSLGVSLQVLAECSAVLTNPRRVSAPFTANEALDFSPLAAKLAGDTL
jgi:hypothetical protein